MRVYADNAATTKVSDKALEAMMLGLTTLYGNPSSLHEEGREAEHELLKARMEIAALMGAETDEIYFTSGGSESDNWAIREMAKRGSKKGKMHLISTEFEHHAVLHTLQKLEKEGFAVTYIKPEANGIIDIEKLKAAIRPDTALVTVMYANNEIGTIQPIKEIADICHEHDIIFHTDAVQALGHIPVNVKENGIDLMSFSGHKFNGPKGVGGLYVKKGIVIGNLIDGGAQERRKRAGTENIPGIMGMAAALKEAVEEMDTEIEKLTALRDRLIDGIIEKIPAVHLNGDRERRVPGNVNFCFEGIEGESLLLRLDLAGIAASSGSACTSGSLDPSHVLLSIGVPKELAHGSLRLSFGKYNTEEEIDYILEVLPDIVKTLRLMSPVWDDKNGCMKKISF
ncbi:MAG: cysteine desulfurase NifS [Eubacteriales bacterium]|nr:cysteine desulfurase NifS [Eubacteriales bacterium]